MNSTATAMRAEMFRDDAVPQDAFERMLAILAPNDPAQQAKMRELFAPLLSGEMNHEEHRRYLEEQYAIPQQ